MNICSATDPYKTCCFTGHRKIGAEATAALTVSVDEIIDRLYREGVRNFRCGGALGFDTLSALCVLRRKHSECRDIRLVLVLPSRDQAKKWSAADRELYERIIASADEVVYAAVEYSRESLLLRDRELVDGCGICVAYLNTNSGGTAYTVRYAKASGLRVINLGSREI